MKWGAVGYGIVVVVIALVVIARVIYNLTQEGHRGMGGDAPMTSATVPGGFS